VQVRPDQVGGGVRLRVGHEKKMSLFFGREEEKEDRKEWEEVRVSDTGSRRAKVSVLLFADDGVFGSLGWTKGRGNQSDPTDC
jgi:hypothetical protein